MLKIGLTGGIGSGKSTVSIFLKEWGIPVVDADEIAREVLNLHPEILKSIALKFGTEFIQEDGSLNRKQFGEFIFSNSEKRIEYEKIIMPYIIDEIFTCIKKYEQKGVDICVLDAPTLMENNIHRLMDKNILVWVKAETQIYRVINRDNITKAQALKRIEAQLSMDYKKSLADYIIDNSYALEDTKKQLEQIIIEIRRGSK